MRIKIAFGESSVYQTYMDARDRFSKLLERGTSAYASENGNFIEFNVAAYEDIDKTVVPALNGSGFSTEDIIIDSQSQDGEVDVVIRNVSLLPALDR